MRWAAIVLALLSVLLSSGHAAAEFVDGRKLSAACDHNDHSYLEAFVAGVADKNSQDISAAMDFSVIASDVPKHRLPILMSVIGRYCPPAGISLQSLAAVACEYLKANTDQNEQAAAKLVVQAFKQAYPCTRP